MSFNQLTSIISFRYVSLQFNHQGRLLNGTVFGAGLFSATLGHGELIKGVDQVHDDLFLKKY